MSKNQEEREHKLSPKIVTGVLVALIFAVALVFRAYLPYDKVFTAEWIKFSGSDAYYQMRLVDNLVHNFPHLTAFDPYIIYPGGSGLPDIHFFNWLLAGIIWVIGLGSPSEHTIDVIGIYFPAVLGALTVIPVYFIGKELFNRWAGILAAGLLAILPGEFLGRSIIGYTDQHVAETLFTSVTILFLILAIKTARHRQLVFNHLRHRDWATIAKPVIYSLLAGLFLGIYLLTWGGAQLFVFIISVYFIIQFIIDHLRHESTDYLCIIGGVLFAVAIIMFGLTAFYPLGLVSLVIALLIPLVLSGVSRLMAYRKIKSVYYPLTLLGLGLVGLGIFYAIRPSFLSSMLNQFGVFFPRGAQLTTMEMQPIFFPSGNFSWGVVWGNFTTSIFLGLIALGVLIYLVIKQGNAEKSLLVVWSLVILAATIGQRRFAYYFVVNIALLTGYLSVLIYYAVRLIIDYLSGTRIGYLSWRILELPDFGELTTEVVKSPASAETKRAGRARQRETRRRERQEARMKRSREVGFRLTVVHTSIILWLVIVFFLVFHRNIGRAEDTASAASFVPSDAWCSSLSWMKENTPDPFVGKPDAYYQLYELPPAGANYTYPESAYGVTAWWDYGYWITRIAHRLPSANPGQRPEALISVANFFTAQDEGSAVEIAQELDSAYVVIDFETATGKFYAMASWAGKERTEFFDVFLVRQDNQIVPVQLYYPEYYRSLSTRLYNFDGKAVTPQNTMVISYQEEVSPEGTPYKRITDVKQFASYEEAEAYLSAPESANNKNKIVGINPFISPVPLEAAEHYRLIYSSNTTVEVPNVGAIPEVKIFEYID